MLPAVHVLCEMLNRGNLLNEAMFANLDWNDVVDARESDRQFEEAWMQLHALLQSERTKLQLNSEILNAIDDVRREAFMRTSVATKQHELSSCVSDDFELIAIASALSIDHPFAECLWDAYKRDRVPTHYCAV